MVSNTVVGITFLPELQCICVVLNNRKKLFLYTMDGNTIKLFELHTRTPVGALALKTKPSTVVVGASKEERLSVMTLAKNNQQEISLVRHMVWKLQFHPCDIASLNGNLILVMGNFPPSAVVCTLTEEGQHLGFIRLKDEIPRGFNPMDVVGISNGFGITVTNDSNEGCLILVNHEGEIIGRYPAIPDGAQSVTDVVVSDICNVHEKHVALSDYAHDRVHLLNSNGVFQKFLLERDDHGILVPEKLHFDSSAEQPRLFVACRSVDDPDDVQVRVYDYSALLEERSPPEGLFDEPNESRHEHKD